MTYKLNPNFNNEDDFAFETPEGLPEPPPEGERILWTGAPKAGELGHRLFATKWIGGIAVLLAVSSLFSPLHANATVGQHAMIVVMLLLAGALGIGFAMFWGWLVAINTRYTITNERIVIRHGVTMPMSINVPFAKIATASTKVRGDASGDVSVALLDGNRVSWFAAYPHTRPWTWQGVQPAFRCVPEAGNVARLLHDALVAHVTDHGDVYVGERPKRQIRTSGHRPQSGGRPSMGVPQSVTGGTASGDGIAGLPAAARTVGA